MAGSDLEILQRALRFETTLAPRLWRASDVGASQGDINRLKGAEPPLIEQKHAPAQLGNREFSAALYKLTDDGRRLASDSSQPVVRVTEAELLKALSIVVGNDELKRTMAYSLTSDKKANFLLVGPPACGKSVMMEVIRNTIPDALMIFGSRTSGRGLSDLIFTKRPRIILLDEADKMRHDVFSLMLGLMQSGELIETKQGNTRDSKFDIRVVAACNSEAKFPREFKSRFAMRASFPEYNRDEFICVVKSMLTSSEGCPPELAGMIAGVVFDNNLGDVRRAFGVWQLMREATETEAIRILNLQLQYSPDSKCFKKLIKPATLPGLNL